jgi:hypothetical protein
MSRPSAMYLARRSQRPFLRLLPCAYCAGRLIEDGTDEHGQPEWICLNCGRPPGAPRQHEEPTSSKTHARWGRGFAGIRA